MGLFDFFKKSKGIDDSKFYSTQFQNEVCALALWKLEENNLNPYSANQALKEVGLNNEQIKYIVEKTLNFIQQENKIPEPSVNTTKAYDPAFLDYLQKLFFENNQSYEAVKKILENDGYNKKETDEIISQLKMINTKMVNNFQEELDSGRITEIKITPNPDHTKENASPDQADKYIGFGAYQMERGHLENALELFDKAIEINENATLAYANKGTLFTKRGDYEKALEFYNKALEIEPNHIQILENKMDLFFDLMDINKEDEFIETVQVLLKNDPENPNALINIIQYYLKNNDIDSALRSVKILFANHFQEQIVMQLLLRTLDRLPTEKALDVFANYKPQINKHAQYQLEYTKGLYLKTLCSFDEAILVYESLNKLQDFSWNYYQIAIMKNLQGKTRESLDYLKITFDLEPGLKEDAKQFPELENLWTNAEFMALTTD